MLSSIRSHLRLLIALAVLLCTAAVFAQVEGQPAAPAATSTLVMSPGVFGGTSCYGGWPIVLELTLWRETPRDAAAPEPLNIAAKEGTWREALRVTVTDGEGKAAPWPLHLVAQEGGQLTLAAGDIARVEWWLSPEETAAIPEGNYRLTVAFDPERVEGLPEGETAVRADPCHLRVRKEPAPLEGDLAAGKLYCQAWYNMVKGDRAAADAAIAQLLAADPQSIGARRLKALLAAREGRREEGLKFIREALEIYEKKHPNACRPVGLDALHQQLQAEPVE